MARTWTASAAAASGTARASRFARRRRAARRGGGRRRAALSRSSPRRGGGALRPGLPRLAADDRAVSAARAGVARRGRRDARRAMSAVGFDPRAAGPTPRASPGPIELHIEQGRLAARRPRAGARGSRARAPLGVASEIWPHGRWRLDFAGARTTRARPDGRPERPAAAMASAILGARAAGSACSAPSAAPAWSWAPSTPSPAASAWSTRAARTRRLCGPRLAVQERRGRAAQESLTATRFVSPHRLGRAASSRRIMRRPRCRRGRARRGVLAGAPVAMVFVRNPTGVSHALTSRRRPTRASRDAPPRCCEGVVTMGGTGSRRR